MEVISQPQVMSSERHINQVPTKKDTKNAIPELLRLRLDARKGSRVMWIVALLVNILLLVLASFFFDAYYFTRSYIINGEDFWNFYKSNQLSNKAVPLNAMLSGMICILTFGFNLMNYIVIGLFIIFGGVRDRIKMASKY